MMFRKLAWFLSSGKNHLTNGPLYRAILSLGITETVYMLRYAHENISSPQLVTGGYKTKPGPIHKLTRKAMYIEKQH
jgi:hypothetical protein